jgi:hypothetical protein
LDNFDDVSPNWFVCTLSSSSSNNWDICKKAGLWGIPTNGRKFNLKTAKLGDFLIFYLAGAGFLGQGIVTGSMKIPADKSEAPWGGGVYRYGVVIPFRLTKESKSPAKISFVINKIPGTNISAPLLRRGFASISESDGLFVSKVL